MTTEKLTFLRVLENYLMYSEALSQYNQLDEEDRKIVGPYIDSLKRKWQEELEHIRFRFTLHGFPSIATKLM